MTRAADHASRPPIVALRVPGGRHAHAVMRGAERALCGAFPSGRIPRPGEAPGPGQARWLEDGAAAAGVVTCPACLRQLRQEVRR